MKAEVAGLLAKAEAADQSAAPDGLPIPDELARRKERLQKLAEARAKIEARAKERFEREQAEYQVKLAAREAREKATGKKPGGKPPERTFIVSGKRAQKPPIEGPRPTDQINLTDEESRIMPISGGGFEQCCNAQAMVAEGSLPVVATNVVRLSNDKQQLEPMLAKINALPKDLGKPNIMLGDNGHFSAANVTACLAAGLEPLLALARDQHDQSLSERFVDTPPAPENPTPVEAMAYRPRTPEGKKLYALRKHTPEPVFGIIKSVIGFRQFPPRGLGSVHGEWNLVTMAWNVKRMFAPKAA